MQTLCIKRTCFFFVLASAVGSIEFNSYRHFDLNPFGGAFTTELVLDDVIINTVVPEPACIAGVAAGAVLLIRRRRARA